MAGVTISPSPTYMKSAPINTATAAQYAPVAGTTGLKILVYRLVLVTTAANTIIFQDGSTSLSGPIPLGANGAITLDTSGDPWFTTSSGNAFNISIGNSTQTSGMMYYTQTSSPPLGAQG